MFVTPPFGARSKSALRSAFFAALIGFVPMVAAHAQQAASATPRLDIEAYDIQGNTLLDEETIESAVTAYLGPGRTRDDVEGARRSLETAYQSAGYQSVVVEIPPQNVSHGIVLLKVVEAPVGRLRVVGSHYYSLDEVKDEVPSLKEGAVPNFDSAQSELADANRLPDRRVVPALKPGKVPGTVDVDLKVSDQLPLHASLELNNDHSANTHSLRAVATVHYDNLWQLGHSLSFTWLRAPQDVKDGQVFAGSYLAPIWGSPWNFLTYGYVSDSNVSTLGGANVIGKGYAAGVRAIAQWPMPGNYSQSLSFGADVKHSHELLFTEASDCTIIPGQFNPCPVVTYLPLVASYSLVHSGTVSNSDLTLSATAGIRGLASSKATFEDARTYADDGFVHVNIDADHTQNLGSDIVAALRFSSQFSDGPLVSSEQFSAGGFTSVRGYLQSEDIGDDGVLGSVELRSPSFGHYLFSFIDEWRLYTFFDAANVWMLDHLAGQQSMFTLYSTGIGTRIQIFKYLSGDVAFALPLRSGIATEARRPDVQFSVKTSL